MVKVKEGEIFVVPGGLPHSPRRFENTWGLVIERKRRDDEKEEFAWFCEKCDELVLSRIVNQGNIPSQVSAVYGEFNADPKLRTCGACGYVFRRRRWPSDSVFWTRKNSFLTFCAEKFRDGSGVVYRFKPT